MAELEEKLESLEDSNNQEKVTNPLEKKKKTLKERSPAQQAVTTHIQQLKQAKTAEKYLRELKGFNDSSGLSGQTNLSSQANPDAMAVADVWYSNHQAVKEKRRADKQQNMEKLLASKLDSYHEKLMATLNEPVEKLLEHIIDTRYEEESDAEEEIQPKIASRKRELDGGSDEPKPSSKVKHDFSRFF